jgi:hypothetical protein
MCQAVTYGDLAKLQLRDRAAAVVYAFDHDLVSPAPDRHGE